MPSPVDEPDRGPAWARRVEEVAVALVTLAVAWPFLRPDRWVTGFDTVAYSGPNLEVTFDAWRHGRLAGWNDLIFGGIPHLANPQTAVLYPVKVLGLPFDVPRALAMLVAVHLAILAVGMVVLARRALRLAPPAAFVTATVVVASGQVMVRSLFFEQISVLAWIPWLLVAIDAAVGGQGRRPGRPVAVAAVAVVTATMLVAGHPQTAYLGAGLGTAWALGRLADLDGGWASRGRAVVGLGVGGVIAGCLAAVQLLPTVDLAGRSASAQGRDLGWVASWAVGARSLPLAVLGDLTAADHPTSVGSHEAVSYVGAVAVALAVVGLCHLEAERRWRVTGALLGLAVLVAMALAVGPRFLPYRVASRLVPVFDQARVPSRWLAVVVFVAAIAAGVAVDRLRRGVHLDGTGRVMAGAVLGGGALVVAAMGVVQGYPAGDGAWVVGLVVGVALLVPVVPARWAGVAALVLAVLVAGELGWLGRHSEPRELAVDHPYTSARSGPIAELVAGQPGRALALTPDVFDDFAVLRRGLRPNTNVTAGVRSIDGYDGGVQVTRLWADAMSGLSDGRFDAELLAREQLTRPLDPAALAGVGVRWLVVDGVRWPVSEVTPGWRGPLLVDGNLSLWENPAWVAEATVRGAGTATDRRAATSARPSPGRVEVTASGPGTLVVDQQFDPGWQVRIDGSPAPAVVVDGLLVGTELPAGEHTVTFRYRPPHLGLGLVLTGLGVLATVGLLLAGPVGDRRAGLSRRGSPTGSRARSDPSPAGT